MSNDKHVVIIVGTLVLADTELHGFMAKDREVIVVRTYIPGTNHFLHYEHLSKLTHIA